MASSRKEQILDHRQIQETFKGLFANLITEQPLNDRNMVNKLWKLLSDNQRLNPQEQPRPTNTLDILAFIRDSVKNDEKSRLLIKGWLESARSQYPKTKSQKKLLEEEIGILKENIGDLNKKISHMQVNCEEERKEKEKLQNQLIQKKEKLTMLKKQLEELKEKLQKKNMETKDAMMRLTDEFFLRYVQNKDDDNDSDDWDNLQ